MNILKKFDWYQWLRYRIWERHHVLKLRYIKPGWHDKDELIIHAMFECLCRFLEDEDPDEIVCWDADVYHAHAWEEMQILYKWWKKRQDRDDDNPIFAPGVEAPGFDNTLDKEWTDPKTGKKERLWKMNFKYSSPEAKKIWNQACDDCTKWEEKCNKEDEEMMDRLIKIRRYMWT